MMTAFGGGVVKGTWPYAKMVPWKPSNTDSVTSDVMLSWIPCTSDLPGTETAEKGG